jgi:hypothetical protein
MVSDRTKRLLMWRHEEAWIFGQVVRTYCGRSYGEATCTSLWADVRIRDYSYPPPQLECGG